MASTADTPDVRRLQDETLPVGGFPAGGRQDFRVFFRPAVHEQIWKHASADVSIEICGVLVGLWERDEAGPYALISEIVRCDSAKSGFAEVTFTHDAWTKINGEMDTRFADLKIVGWYHSHPNFGIFLSDRDVFIHQHFFSGPGQIAHVVDPVRKIDGVFAWEAGKPVLRPHFWVGERICVTPDKPAEDSAPRPAGLRAPGDEYSSTGSSSSAFFGSLTTVLLMACVFLIGFLISGRMTDFERHRERQRDLFGVMAYFADHKLLRPGLDDGLEALGTQLRNLSVDADKLAREHAKREVPQDAKQPDDSKQIEPWEQLRLGLADASQKLNHIRRKDLLTPDEELLVKEAMRELRELAARAEKSGDAAAMTVPVRKAEKDGRPRPPAADEPQKKEPASSKKTPDKEQTQVKEKTPDKQVRPADDARSKKE